MESSIGKMFSHIGQIDRDSKQDNNIRPLSGLHDTLLDLNININNDLTPERAVQLFTNIRDIRHNNWLEYLNQVKAKDYFNFIDTKVSTFISFLNGLGLDVEVPTNMLNKTPDILLYDSDTGVVYVGDVTVTNSPGAARATKYEKYRPIAESIRKSGVIVIDSQFAVKYDLSNLRQLLMNFRNINLIITENEKLESYKHFSLLANDMMSRVRENCTNNRDFNELLKINDRVKEEANFLVELDAELDNIDVSPYLPSASEIDIIDMVKTETDKINPDEYFADNVEPSLQSLNEVIDSNKGKKHMEPKASIKILDNSQDIELENNHNLISSYISDILRGNDDDIQDYILHILPTAPQNKLMSEIYVNNVNSRDIGKISRYAENKVFGPYQYKMTSSSSNFIIRKLEVNLNKGKKERNTKDEPAQIDLDYMIDYYKDINQSMIHYGNISNKPRVMDDSWDARTKFENDNTMEMRDIYNYVCHTNAAQLTQSISMLYSRLIHLSTNQGMRDNVFVPPNSSFICIIPKNHAPVTSKNVDMPFLFITRYKKGKYIPTCEYEYYYEGDEYIYLVSKLCRLNMEKIVNWSNSSYKLISTSCYLLNRCSSLMEIKNKVVGCIMYMILDTHQKTSEYLDLLKYVSFMPFSDISRLPELIKDKFDLLLKTKLDAWMLESLRQFIEELGDKDKLKAKKPKIKTFNTNIVTTSLGIDMNLPSFLDRKVRHNSPSDFIEEIGLIYTVRPKHLYGSQFMDKSITDTCKWNLEYEKEVLNYGKWATDGVGDGPFPFNSKFCYSSDAIFYAEQLSVKRYGVTKAQVENNLIKGTYFHYMHENCTLRGCTKSKDIRDNKIDIHTTSLDACIDMYREHKFDNKACRAIETAKRSIISGFRQEYSMSEKDQRGGGRPIATPTLGTKAELMMVEKPEASKGKYMDNNIIVPDKNKAQEQCKTYKSALEEGIRQKFKYVYQLTEDQTKYSENDNPLKYLAYIRSNESLSDNAKKLQISVINRLLNRVHLIKRLPKNVKNDPNLHKFIVDDEKTLGVMAIIGWPQGMLNFISTSVHSAADLWITYAYNKAYPNNRVYTKGLVHSDDSWAVICTNSLHDFKKFVIFRMLAKKLFCLKLNEKKLWGSSYMGELVSNYNLNGNVHLSVAKTIANSFGNLTYQCWPIDVSNQVSSIQQCYRQGATVPDLIMMATILRQQLMSSYKVKGTQLELLDDLPVDIGGYPDVSAFELAVNGINSHYKKILNKLEREPRSKSSIVIKQCLKWSLRADTICHNAQRFHPDIINAANDIEKIAFEDPSPKWSDEDYENLQLPSRGDVFRAIRHIFPKSSKLAKTITNIRSLEYKGDGLEMIITRPESLSQSLGHLVSRAQSKLFELASSKYTQNTRRLAINQSIQSSGKIIRVGKLPPMTFNEMYNVAMKCGTFDKIGSGVLSEAFNDGDEMVETCHNVVYMSESVPTDNDKRKVINRMPFIEDKFNTIAKFTDVLLRIIDGFDNGNRLFRYSKPTVELNTIDKDCDLLKKRFNSYFRYYAPEVACSLIMQQKLSSSKTRLWMQPYLRTDNIIVYLEDLYGKTMNKRVNYSVKTIMSSNYSNSYDKDLVQTMYSTLILNKIYPNSFVMNQISGLDVKNAIDDVDYSKLNDNDKLKYGVCQVLINNSDDALRLYSKNKTYRQEYLVRQVYRNGTYHGDYKVICKQKDIVATFQGDNKSVSITVNKPDIPSILNIMKKFVTINFKHHSYEHAGSWGLKDFWTSGFKLTETYLTWWSSVSTTITHIQTERSIPIIINPDLLYPTETSEAEPDGFSFDSSLRVINCIINRKRIRLDNIHQSFSLPMRKNVLLEPDVLQGFDVQSLYSSGVIEATVLNNPHLITKSDAKSLLEGSIGLINNKPIIISFIHLISKVLRQNYNPHYTREVKTVEMTDTVLTGANLDELVEIDDSTSPDDLTSLALEYSSSVSRVGRIHHTGDLLTIICSAYIGTVNIDKKLSFIHHLIKDPNITSWGKMIRDKNNEVTLSMIMDVIDKGYADFMTDLELYSFIIVSRLDIKESWESIKLSNLGLIYDSIADNSESIKRLVNKYIENINENVFCGKLLFLETLLDLDSDE
uniref:RNA-dependent RNA polymerase n=1 Tax=Hubei diptera virus 7 TaxID=1922888 RepID=A0A1L3KPH9_9VIRU|nr:RNA-dependent RNA polymerase [Hubei diptera virus 7]